MKTLRSIPALGAFFVLVALAVSACGSSVPSNAVAMVAGNPITLQAFDHWMYVDAKGQAAQNPTAPVIVPNDPPSFAKCIAQARADVPTLKKAKDAQIRVDCKQLFTSLSSQVMDFLIKAYWYQADAHKLGINLTDAQVQKALATAKKGQFTTAAQFQTFLKQSGQTEQDIEYRVRVNQIFMKLWSRRAPAVTPTAIAAYYAAHKTQFGTPETRDMRIVLTKTAAQAQTAKKALQRGQSWSAVAKKYSIDPTTKAKGGVLTNVTAGQQDAALSTAAFAASINKLLGPVKGQFGFYVLEVTKITPATQKSLASTTPLIKQTLAGTNQQAAQAAVDSHAKKAWLTKTTCRALYSMADCKGYKAPKAPGANLVPTAPSSAGTTAAPTPTVSSASPSASSTTSK